MPSAAFPQYPNVRTTLPDCVLILGRINPDPTTPTIIAGKGFTVSKPGTGLYRVTLNKRIGHWVSAVGLYHRSAGANFHLDGELLSDANNYATFRLKNNTGTAVDGTGGGTDEISFILAVMMTKLPVK